jgi:hypothetical protein
MAPWLYGRAIKAYNQPPLQPQRGHPVLYAPPVFYALHRNRGHPHLKGLLQGATHISKEYALGLVLYALHIRLVYGSAISLPGVNTYAAEHLALLSLRVNKAPLAPPWGGPGAPYINWGHPFNRTVSKIKT